MKDTRAEREADRLYSLLSPDAGGYRLSGGRELRPEGTFRNPRTIIEDRRGPSLLRITRNPVTIGGRVVKATPGQRILTLRTEPFAYIADRNLIAFTDMLVRRHMRVHLDYSLDGDRGMRLLTPTDAQMGELGEIIRIYDGRRPARSWRPGRVRSMNSGPWPTGRCLTWSSRIGGIRRRPHWMGSPSATGTASSASTGRIPGTGGCRSSA